MSNNPPEENINTSHIQTILDIPRKGAIKIFMKDTWFDGNPQIRYIKFIENGTNISTIEKKNDNSDSNFKAIDINGASALQKKSINDIETALFNTNVNSGLFRAFLFSVNGNYKPFKIINAFKGANMKLPEDRIGRQFLGHMAWFLASGGLDGWGVKDDLIVKLIGTEKYLGIGDNIITIMDKYEESELFKAYKEIVEKIENGEIIEKIKNGLKLDYEKATDFYGQPSNNLAGGGKRKKVSNTKRRNNKKKTSYKKKK